jgi:ribosomal protein L40E
MVEVNYFPILLLILVVGAAIGVIVATARRFRRHAISTDARLCRNCGLSHPPFAQFCRRCGSKLS